MTTYIGILYSQQTPVQAAHWQPTLVMPEEFGSASVGLVTLEIFPLKIPQLTFSLESSYKITRILPRSYFGVLCQCNIQHSFVFNLLDRESLLFQELAGMRQSVAVSISSNDHENWELHLKPSKGVIFGYLVKPMELQKVIQEQADMLLRARKLPLVLDLDDTLVRVVGNTPGRYVSEEQAQTVPHRVRMLKDGRRVVLAERVHEFLHWAAKSFDISVCSLGDQAYVDMVVHILNSEGLVIRGGVNYSARGEYLYLTQQQNIKKTPKDLKSLYAFYHIKDSLPVTIDPLILDDNATMWPVDQQDNIIIVREQASSPVWNVSLFPVVQQALQYIYDGFFRNLDTWAIANPKNRGQPTPSLTFYKEYLRRELSNMIAEK